MVVLRKETLSVKSVSGTNRKVAQRNSVQITLAIFLLVRTILAVDLSARCAKLSLLKCKREIKHAFTFLA
jgi:hypothetical protein